MSKIPIVDSGTMEQVLFSLVFREFARRVVMFFISILMAEQLQFLIQREGFSNSANKRNFEGNKVVHRRV